MMSFQEAEAGLQAELVSMIQRNVAQIVRAPAESSADVDAKCNAYVAAAVDGYVTCNNRLRALAELPMMTADEIAAQRLVINAVATAALAGERLGLVIGGITNALVAQNARIDELQRLVMSIPERFGFTKVEPERVIH